MKPFELKEIKPEYPDTNIPVRIQGRNLFKAPQPALTAPSAFTLTGNSGVDGLADTEAAVLNAALTRINEIEAALVKLGLLRHR